MTDDLLFNNALSFSRPVHVDHITPAFKLGSQTGHKLPLLTLSQAYISTALPTCAMQATSENCQQLLGHGWQCCRLP